MEKYYMDFHTWTQTSNYHNAYTEPVASYKEVENEGTLYRLTSVFYGGTDMERMLEQLALRRAMMEGTEEAGNGPAAVIKDS